MNDLLKCPVCQSEDTEPMTDHAHRQPGDQIVDDMVCNDCGTTFEVIYTPSNSNLTEWN